MTKTQQRKQLREIAKSLRYRHKVELMVALQKGGDVEPYPINKAPLITGNEYQFYLVGYRRDGFGCEVFFYNADSIDLKLTPNGIEAA